MTDRTVVGFDQAVAKLSFIRIRDMTRSDARAGQCADSILGQACGLSFGVSVARPEVDR